jgi:hypothetical protein
MSRKLNVTCATLLVALMSGFSAAANAEPDTELQKVAVAGKKGGEAPRTDVRLICPAIAVSLNDALENAWFREQLSGTVRVQFRIEGGNITDVTPSGGPRAYYRYIRPAVLNLGCANDKATERDFAFNIKFVDPLERASADRVALQF